MSPDTKKKKKKKKKFSGFPAPSDTNRLATDLSFRHLEQGIQEFHRKYVLVAADTAANNVVVVCRLHYVNTLKQELDGTRAYLETDTDEMSVVNALLNDLPVKFSVLSMKAKTSFLLRNVLVT